MKLGSIIERFAERMHADDQEGALDVLDRMFFSEWPELKELRPGEREKLLKDVRGLVVASFQADEASKREPVTNTFEDCHFFTVPKE